MMSFSDALKLSSKALQDIVAKGGPDARMAQAEINRRSAKRGSGSATGNFVPSPQSGMTATYVVPTPVQMPAQKPESEPAQVPMMITRKMEADLTAMGYSELAISHMTPAAAWKILGIRNNPKKKMSKEEMERAISAVTHMFNEQKTVVNTRFAPTDPRRKSMRYMVLVPDADFREDKYMDIIQTNDYVRETEKEVQFINGVGSANGMIVIDTHAGALNWQLPVAKQPPDLLSHLLKKK